MAYVAVSNQLKYDIRNKIYRMRHLEIHGLGEQPQIVPTREELEAGYWGNYLPLKDQIPGHWKETVGQIRVDAFNGHDMVYSQYYNHSYMDGPPRRDKMAKIVLHAGDPRVDKYLKWKSEVKDISDRWEKVENTIMSFLNTCKSVNEALKLMPELAHYLDKDVIDRVNRKVEKKKGSEAVLPDQELRDTMIASVVAARLSE